MQMRLAALALALALALVGACTGDEVTGGLDGPGGKADQHDTGSNAEVVSCDGAALIIEPAGDGRYRATVSDPAVVAWFVEQSRTIYSTEVEYSGQVRPVSMERRFPWMVSVEGDDEAPLLVISDLTASGSGFSSSGPGGVTLRRDGAGMRLEIDGHKMVSSHIVVYYDIGEWGFQSCEGQAEPPPSTASHFADDTRNPASHDIAVEADALDCELYIDSFAAREVYIYHGAGHAGLQLDVRTRDGNDVSAVGMYLLADEEVTRDGEVVATHAGRELLFELDAVGNGLYRGHIHTDVSRFDVTARRTIFRFALFADIASGDSTRRFWLKPASYRDFVPGDYSPDTYDYSARVAGDSGEGVEGLRYLWRDSGSPIFYARQACLAR